MKYLAIITGMIIMIISCKKENPEDMNINTSPSDNNMITVGKENLYNKWLVDTAYFVKTLIYGDDSVNIIRLPDTSHMGEGNIWDFTYKNESSGKDEIQIHYTYRTPKEWYFHNVTDTSFWMGGRVVEITKHNKNRLHLNYGITIASVREYRELIKIIE